MKRMVLIPEERLLRYEQRDKEDSKLPDGVMYGGGTEEAVRGIPKKHESRSAGITVTFERKRGW